MQDYFKSFLLVEWPHFRKPELLTFNFLSALAVSANVQVIVCVKGNHTGYAASVIHEHGPKLLETAFRLQVVAD